MVTYNNFDVDIDVEMFINLLPLRPRNFTSPTPRSGGAVPRDTTEYILLFVCSSLEAMMVIEVPSRQGNAQLCY